MSIWILIGIGAFIWYGIKFGEYNWGIMSGFATWTLAGGVFLVFFQIQEARKGTNAQVAVELFRELRREEIIETLRYIYTLNQDDSPFILIENEKRVERLMDKFELLGILVNQGIVNERIAIEAFAGPPALRCWHQLVRYLRKQENDRGFYILNYEDFVRRSFKHFKKHKIDIIFTQDGKDDVNLIENFQVLIDRRDELRPRTLNEIRHEKRQKES